MHCKFFFFLFSLFSFNALQASKEIDIEFFFIRNCPLESIETDSKKFLTAIKNNDIAAMEKLLANKKPAEQKQIIQSLISHPFTSDHITPLTFGVSCCLCTSGNITNLDAIKYITEHDAFDANFIVEEKPLITQSEYLIQYFCLKEKPRRELIDVLKNIIKSGKCEEKTIMNIFTKLLFCLDANQKDQEALTQIKELLADIQKDKNFNIYNLDPNRGFDTESYLDRILMTACKKKDTAALKMITTSFDIKKTSLSLDTLLESAAYFDHFLSSASATTTEKKKELIELLITHGITDCNLQFYKENKDLIANPDRLTIHSKSTVKSFSLIALISAFIGTAAYDFHLYKPIKPEKEKLLLKKEKKDLMDKKTKEEEKEDSFKNYLYDLWKNPTNHKKLAIAPTAIACILILYELKLNRFRVNAVKSCAEIRPA